MKLFTFPSLRTYFIFGCTVYKIRVQSFSLFPFITLKNNIVSALNDISKILCHTVRLAGLVNFVRFPSSPFSLEF